MVISHEAMDKSIEMVRKNGAYVIDGLSDVVSIERAVNCMREEGPAKARVFAIEGVTESLEEIAGLMISGERGLIEGKTFAVFQRHMQVLQGLGLTGSNYTRVHGDMCTGYHRLDNEVHALEISEGRKAKIISYGSWFAARLLQAAYSESGTEEGKRVMVVCSSDESPVINNYPTEEYYSIVIK